MSTALRARMRPLALALLCAAAAPARGDEKKGVSLPPVVVDHLKDPTIPANPKLVAHSKWFDPKRVFDMDKEHWPLADKDYPRDLSYKAYSAVGYDLANTIVLVGPEGWVVIDTLGSPGWAEEAISAIRAKVYGSPDGGPKKLPIRAIIYTHNHIDHTFGVWGFINQAQGKPCDPENAADAGRDTPLDADALFKDKGCFSVIGQEQIVDGVSTTATITGSIIDARSSYMYGSWIGANRINCGIGPAERGPLAIEDGKVVNQGGKAGFRVPSKTFKNGFNLRAAGVNMHVLYVPSETNDELAVFVPDGQNRRGAPAPKLDGPPLTAGRGLLQSAEVIQGPSFPNLYSLRGTSYRDPSKWFQSVDVLRGLDSWCMLPSHGPPLCEHQNIETLLVNFRDAIQFTHDQAIRYLNLGYTEAQLPELIHLPEYLLANLDQVRPILNKDSKVVDPRDYLTAFYGSVPQAVREIYTGSVGWYSGDAVELQPTPQQESAARLVGLVGPDKAVAEAKASLDKAGKLPFGTPEWRNALQWSAELATLVIHSKVTNPPYPFLRPKECLDDEKRDPQLKDARRTKASALELLGQDVTNPNWRGFYLTAAKELRCELVINKIEEGLVAPGVIAGLPAANYLNSLTMRLKAEQTAKDNRKLSIGFVIDGRDQGFPTQGFVIQVARSVARFIEIAKADDVTGQADVVMAMTKNTLNKLIEKDGKDEFKQGWKELVEGGEVRFVKGKPADVLGVGDWFDPKPVGIPVLSGR